jgi:type IV pilus assembly protein PilA
MISKLKNQEKGFTIIEVLIVLVIAGLIMLIVFLAVPALQRNSRNTQRKNDVAGLLGAVSEYSNNRNGQMPTTVANITNNAKVGYYATSAITLDTDGTATNAGSAESVIIVTGAKCAQAGTPPANTGDAVPGGTRQVVALYSVENGSGTPDKICQEG